MRALLSIKPIFADRIFEETKKFEFRRSIFKQPVTKVVVYASAPTSLVVGEFDVDAVIYDDLDKLWATTKQHAGIPKHYFYHYFQGKNKGYAIKIGKVYRYKETISLQQKYGIQPPQSYLYLFDNNAA